MVAHQRRVRVPSLENGSQQGRPNHERVISQIDRPQFNHNGHWIGFGPDNMLYISTGDGGYANDWGIGHNVTTGNGQDLRSLHGKMLRLDVNKPDLIPADNPFVGQSDALPQIWALGLRNPWRCPSTWVATGRSIAEMCSRTPSRRSASSAEALISVGAAWRRQVLRLREAG